MKPINITSQAKASLNALAAAVNEHLFEGCRDWYWVAEEEGDICCFDENDFLQVTDMIRILELNVSYDDYAKWRDYNIDHDQHINLKSWLMGARPET